MPTLLLSFKRGDRGEILIHGTLAPSETRAAAMMQEHADICPKFGPAFKGDETIEEEIEVESIPEFNEEAIAEWIAEVFETDSDEDDDDEGDTD
jgi:hypothetical protein